MNQQALNDAYKLFTNAGYNKSIDEFQILLSENPKALADSYALFTKAGYTGNEDSYRELLGLKKKDPSEVSTSPTEGGESVSGGTEALDQSLQDRLDQGHIDLSTFTTGTDQEAMEQSTIAEKTRIYDAYGIDYNEFNDLKNRRDELEQEKIEYQDNLLKTRFLMIPGTEIKTVNGELKYYRPAGDIGIMDKMRAMTSGESYKEYVENNPEIFAPVEISREEAVRYTEEEEEFGMGVMTDVADWMIGALSEEGTRTSRDQDTILDDIGETESKINEISDQTTQAEEYYNTRMLNSLIDQGYKGDRLNQLIENAGIDSEYVKSKAFMINGEETSPANIEDKMYDRDFVSGLQDGSIKVSIDPAVAETSYGKYIENAIAIQSNAGSEISDVMQEFIAGGFGSVAGVLEVGEAVEGMTPLELGYGEEGGLVARNVNDVAKQIRMAQRMYKNEGFMEAMRAGEYKDAAFLLGRGVAGSGMQIAAMAVARYYGVDPRITMALMGVSAGGQKSLTLKEMRRANKAEEDRIKGSEKYQNATPENQEAMLSHLTFNMNDFEIALNSALSGGFEMLFEIPTYQMINGVQTILKQAPKYTAKEVADQVTKGALRDIVGEGLSEAGTEISTMIVDHVTGAGTPESFDEIVNQVGNAAAAGIGMGTGIKTIGATTAVGVSAYNSIKGTDLTDKIVATYQVVNEDGSLGETKELTGTEYKEWSKDPENIAGELSGDIKVNRYNSDIANTVEDIANTNSEDVIEANNDVNEAGSEANSLLNEIENEMKGEDASVPSSKIAKVKGLLNRMSDIIKETGAKGIQDIRGLQAKLNTITSDAGLSLNDNVANQNTDNANIQSTETITEIQTEAQAKAVAKALKEGKDPSVVLSQESVGVSKDGSSVSENNITVGKFESKDAAKKALDQFKKQNSKAAVEERRHAETQKKNNKAFNKVDKENLDEVSQEEVGGDYNVISASVENLSESSNEQRNSKLEKVLQKKGLKYKKVQVVENGVSKTAFMVEGMDSAAALDLATGFGQKSITSSKDGILHRDGTVESLDGNVYFGPNARNGAKIVVMNVNGRKVSMRLGTNKPSYSKDFNSKNIEDINSFIEYLPENQKKILGHVLRFFSNIKGLNVRVVKTTSAMKKQLEADGYPADKINSIASNRAFYRGSDGTMVLNLQNMNLNTPFHEIVHPLVDFIKLENPELYSRIEEMVQKSESNIPGSPFKKRWYKNGKRQSGSYMDWAKANYPGKPLSLQVEEAFAEMIGDAAANQFMKDNSKMKQLKDFLAEILEYFNLPTDFLKDKEVTDLRLEDIKDIGQLRGNLGTVLARGKTVSVGGVDFNISKPKNTKETDNSIREQVNNQQHGDDLGVTEVMSLEGVETQEVRFQAGDYTPNFDQNKVKRGSISDFAGQKAMLMCIDRSVSGTVESPSGVVKEFNGGMYYSYQDGTGVWAFSSKSAASKVINKAKESDGLVFLTAMSPQSIDGSVEMFDYVMDEVDNAIKKRKVKRKVALDFINKKLNLKKVQDKLSREGISKKKVKSITEFRELILSLDGAFDVRKDLVSKMISGKDLSSWGVPTREEMYSIVNQGDIKDLTGNPVVAAIRIDTESGFIDSRENTNIKDHPTYSYVVKGEPLMVFDQAVDASELWGDLNLADKYLIDPKTGQPYSEGTTAARRNAAIMMATPVVDVRAQANDSFTGGRNQYGRFNVIPSREYVTARPEDLSLENVAGLSSKGNWAIITGTVEADGGYDADVNVSNNARLYKELVEEFGAENVVITDGVYLNKDQGPSYFISGITESRATQIGKNFDQEGVLTRRGNIFTDGSGMNPASEKVYVGKEALAQDGSSTTPDGVTFSLDIDWKSKVPLSDGIRAQAGENVEFVSNAQVSLSMLSDNNRQPEQWVKEISKTLKGASRDVDTMGLLDLLKAYKKDAKVKSVPKEVVAQLIATNMAQIETNILEKDPEIDHNNYELNILEGEREGYKLVDDRHVKDIVKFREYTVKMPNGDVFESRIEAKEDVKDLSYSEVDNIIRYTLRLNLSPDELKMLEETKYSESVLPGGKNYREFLIRDKSPDDIFTAPHFDDLGQNLIASARVDDRVGPNGEKILFVQEIQSDWAQEGKRRGFSKKENTSKIEELENEKQKVLNSSTSYKLLNEKTEGNLSVNVFNAIQQIATDSIDNQYFTKESRKERFLDKIGETLNYWGGRDNAVPKMNKNEFSNFYDTYILELQDNAEKSTGYGVSYTLASLSTKIRDLNNQIFENKAVVSSIPGLPWNQTDLWVGLTIRKLINQASKEGYDQIAFVDGKQSDRVQGHGDDRTAEFYDKIVPKNINNELKRLVKGMKHEFGEVSSSSNYRFNDFKLYDPSSPQSIMEDGTVSKLYRLEDHRNVLLTVNYDSVADADKNMVSSYTLNVMGEIKKYPLKKGTNINEAAPVREKISTDIARSLNKQKQNVIVNLTPELKAATDKVGTMRFQAGGNISEDQMTVLKSTYSDIESKYPDIQIDEGMIKMYHYSDNELDVVDPRSAVMNSYSKQEYRTWGRSRVFFYTDPNIKEGVVGGHYKNTTVFPVDRLYPLTEDPLGLNEMAQNNIEVKRNSGDKTQATITLDATTLESADMAISKFRSLAKDMGLNDIIDFGDVTENYRYKKNEDGTTDRAGVESISFTVTYPLGSENINSLVKETFDNSRFEKIDPQTQPINTFEEVAKVAESLGFQGFIYDHVGGKTVSSWHPVEILDDRFQVNDQDQNDVHVSGLGAIMWDLTKPIIDADYALGEWMTKVKDKDRPYSIRATQLFAKPKGMHSNSEIKEMVILSRGKLDEQMFIANKNQKNLKAVVKQEKKRIKATPEYQQATAQQQEAMLSHLTPEGLNDLIGNINKIMELPEQSKLRQAVMQVRDHIDTLSTYLYENGLVSGPMKYTIEGNLGFYLTRAYKKYESSSWRQADQEVIRRAELFVANQLMSDKGMSKEDAMVRAKQMVDNLVKDKMSAVSFKRNMGIGSSMTRVNDIFKERNEDLPKEIRDLLGEIHEPYENYVNTISKLARTVTSHQLYEDLIQMGMGKFVADPNIDDDKTSQVPGIGNKLEGKKWGPLEGKFVDNEMFAMLNAYESNALFDSKAYKVWMTFVYGSKKFATVHNPGTHAVNLIGNTFFSLANGHVNPIKFYDAARTAIGEITNLSGKEREAFYQELVSLGVVSSSASLAEIVQIGQDIAAGKDVTSFLDKMNQGKAEKVGTTLLKGVRWFDKAATKAYQAEDDMFKIFGFMTEKSRYMDAGMSEAEATAIAARNTRNTYPNYDMVPSIVRAIGRSPIVGTFVAFQSEAIRCTKNALQLALQEMGSNNPKVKLMGAKRMAFSLSALTFMETLTATAMSMLFGMGGDDEDDDIETYGLRHLTAPWDKDSKLVPIEKGYFTPDHEGYSGENNGNAYVQYMNVSRLSGGGIVKDALRVAFSDMNSPDKQNAIVRIGKTLANTFLSQDMALQVIEEVRQNKGNKVYNPTDDLNKILFDVSMYIGKDLGPGAIKRAVTINDSMKEHSEKITYHEILATVGLRISTIDVNKALYFRARDLYSDMRSRSEGEGYDLRVKDLSLPNALRPGTDTFDPKMSLYFNNLVDVVATARRYGVPLSEGKNNCREILRKAGVPSHVIDKVMYNVYNGKNRDSLLIMYK